MAPDVPLLVISCDRYADLWRPFFEVFWQRWPDCPFHVYLGTNHLEYPSDRVTTLAVGADVDWASNVLSMLDCLDAPYVLVFLEDFLIQERVNTALVTRLVAIAQEHDLGCLRLAAGLPLALPPSRAVTAAGVEGLGVVQPGEAHRVSAQVAVWRVETLRSLLVPGFSPWEFEAVGTQLSEEMPDAFWGTYSPAIVYDQCVEKGRWKLSGVEICRAAGVDVDLAARPMFSPADLQMHYEAARAGAEMYLPKERARKAFLAGFRRRGLCHSLSYLRQHPLAPEMWALALVGLLGPAATRSAQRLQLRARVLRSKLKHQALAQRRRGAQTQAP